MGKANGQLGLSVHGDTMRGFAVAVRRQQQNEPAREQCSRYLPNTARDQCRGLPGQCRYSLWDIIVGLCAICPVHPPSQSPKV
ncbi:MAG: hypothetical protein ACREMY_19740, partial [bacterium]